MIDFQCPAEDLELVAKSQMSAWIELATTPYGSVLDAAKLFWPVAIPRKSHVRAAAKMRAAKLENEFCRNIGLESSMETVQQDKIGDVSSNSFKIIVGADVDASVTHTRVVTATALGIFASKLPEKAMQHVVDPLWNALTSLSGVQRQVLIMSLSWILYPSFVSCPSLVVLFNLLFILGGIYGSYFLVQRDKKQGC